MIEQSSFSDTALARHLDSLEAGAPGFWSFRGNARRDHGHGLMQYPAMMVPQMVAAILDAVTQTEGDVRRVLDPFVGSGTVLTETALRGLDFVGSDVNPLAVLLCKVKAGPINPETVRERSEACIGRVRGIARCPEVEEFSGHDKWFTKSTRAALTRVRDSIRREGSLEVRRFLWVALAETVRRTSNSRTSTFKLHVRSSEERRRRRNKPVDVFERVVRENLVKYDGLGASLRKAGLLGRGKYKGEIRVHLGDSRRDLPSIAKAGSCDIVFTSPPYGDNATTVPYGQYSYLPLSWIDLHDIEPGLDATCLATTHEIDRRSLGGSKRVDMVTIESLCDLSQTLGATLQRLVGSPLSGMQRIASFALDLDRCVLPAVDALRPGGLMVWVLGNRRVGGCTVPLDGILTDLLRARSCKVVRSIQRAIPSKRMAVRNNIDATMLNETVLVARKV